MTNYSKKLKLQRKVRNKIRKVEFNRVNSTYRHRLSVFRSGKHIYLQLIDDRNHKTVASASTLEKAVKAEFKNTCNKKAAEKIGSLIAERVTKLGNEFTEVVFDKGHLPFHGVIKAAADAARAGGLRF